MNDKEIQKADAGTVSRQEFGAQSLAKSGETVATVLAARAKAEVEARFIMAMNRPRDWDVVRAKMMKAVERPGFAGSATEKIFGAAWYVKPISDGIEGFSVRFAEEAIRCMGNLDARSEVIWEDDTKRIVAVTVMDLETNVSIPVTLVIEKVVEKSYLKRGQEAISVRTNSQGKPTYLVDATPDEVLQRQNALISKAIRNGVLRLLPGDIQAECKARILEIRRGSAAKDPDGGKKQVIDGFAKQNISPAELKKYLGHDLDILSIVELDALRELYGSIKDKKITWHDVMVARAEEDGAPPPPADPEKTPLETLTKDLQGKEPTRDVQAEIGRLAKVIYGEDWLNGLEACCDANSVNMEKMGEDGEIKILGILSGQLEGAK